MDINRNFQKGYTLIEILVAISIFTVVIATSTGFFVSSLKSQQRVLSSQALVDNVSYTLEYMSRALRMAKKDDLDGVNCLSGDKVNFEINPATQGIKFRNYQDECQEFFLENGRLKESKQTVENFLTSEKLEVVSFKIGTTTPDIWSQGDDKQARVTLSLEMRSKGPAAVGSQPTIQIQTTISQRNLDVYVQY